jgi:hypothetical protein
MRRLAIGEPLCLSEDRRERQVPGGLSRLPTRGEERQKGVIRERGSWKTQRGRHGPFQMEWGRSASGEAWDTSECLSEITTMPMHRTSA